MKKSAWIFAVCICILVLSAGNVAAKTPDGKPPSVETVCDDEVGAAFGLCNAYCEAMDCTDPNQHASNQGCQSVRENFEKKTGRPLPCTVACPCGSLLQLFADITSGAVQVKTCVSDDAVVYVTTESGDYAFVSTGVVNMCSVNNEPPLVVLSPTELLVCRVALRKAAEAQGVVCKFPE
ncbi:MAG: hypothetical protein ABI779_26230 [Acidobacteriota bacterium]